MAEIKIGLAVGTLTDISPENEIHLLKEHGFDATFTMWKSDEYVKEMADILAKEGMIYSSVHAPFSKAAKMWQDNADGEDAEKELRACLDSCAAVNVPILVVHPFIGFKDHTPGSVGLARFCRLAEYAQSLNVKIAIENVEGEEYLDYLLNGLTDFPSVGFCLDSGHELCYNRGRDLLADYGDRLCYLHINSNMGITSPDDEITFHDDSHMLPFDGKVSMEHLAARLNKLNYRGVLMMELVRGNRPERHTNDCYLKMSDDEYLTLASQRIRRLAQIMSE